MHQRHLTRLLSSILHIVSFNRILTLEPNEICTADICHACLASFFFLLQAQAEPSCQDLPMVKTGHENKQTFAFHWLLNLFLSISTPFKTQNVLFCRNVINVWLLDSQNYQIFKKSRIFRVSDSDFFRMYRIFRISEFHIFEIFRISDFRDFDFRFSRL